MMFAEAELQDRVLDLLRPLRVHLFEFVLVPEHDLVLPRWNKANVLRGAFGYECRRLVCGPHFHDDCNDCAPLQSCPYAVIFEPAPPAGATQLRNFQDIPRPYLFRVGPDSKIIYTFSDRFSFRLVLIGSIADYFPYFIVVFRELGNLGMGVNRGKFRIDSVESLDPVSGQATRIYSCNDNLVRAERMELGAAQIAESMKAMNPESMTLEFLSPTKLIFKEKEVHEPEFHHIFKRLRDRISSLLHFYCGAATTEQHRELFRLLGELSEKIQITRSNLRREENFRLTRRKEHHPLSGFTGAISFSGDLRPFLPFLVAGQWIGVGKNTVFGNGWYELK